MTINAFVATAVASAAPPPGGIPVRVLRNQLEYCSLICPYVVQGAVTVPVGIGTAPVAFVGTLLSSTSLASAAGAAAVSVTAPLRAATDPIITNDLSLVLPKAQNALQVSVVELIDVGFATGDPGALVQAIDDARTNIAAALDQPVGEPVGPTGAVNLPQVVAVQAINVASAVAFQATEAALLDVVETADDTAQTLARTGNVVVAVSVGARGTANAVTAAHRTVTDSVSVAARDIRSSLRDPFPMTGARRTAEAATTTRTPAARRSVDRVIHRVVDRATSAAHARGAED